MANGNGREPLIAEEGTWVDDVPPVVPVLFSTGPVGIALGTISTVVFVYLFGRNRGARLQKESARKSRFIQRQSGPKPTSGQGDMDL